MSERPVIRRVRVETQAGQPEAENTNSRIDVPNSVVQTSTPSLNYLINTLVKFKASDLHLKPNRPPLFRVNDRLVAAKMRDLAGAEVQDILFSILTDEHIRTLEKHKQIDMGFQIKNLGRFRLNVFYQKNELAGVIRSIPLKIPTLDELAMPPVLKELCLKKRGLILVTGSTGSGKSTTLAAMINHINEKTSGHIITIEDPIEFTHADIRSSVSQREIGVDINDPHKALVGALRQDPDVIMLGEMRETTMIETALSAAETGHLVLSTLHTTDARTTIDRIVDVFPTEGQNQVRISLAVSLLAIVSQRLVPKAQGDGMIAACEILIKSKTIEDYIMKNEIEKIDAAIQEGAVYYKMQTFNQHLEKLAEKGIITKDDALVASHRPDELKMRFMGMKREEGFNNSGT